MAKAGNKKYRFAYSPITPLRHHMRHVCKTVSRLPSLFEAMVAEDWKLVKKVQKKVTTGEHAAGDMNREIRHHLLSGLLMPVNRRDVLDVLMMQEMIVNHAKDVSGIILSRKMKLPEDMRDAFLVFGQGGVDSVAQLRDVITTLDEPPEASSSGGEVERVEEMIIKLNESQIDTTRQQRKLQNTLFDHEDDLSPIDVMFTYKIISSIGEISDYAQRIGSRLQLMLAR